MPSLTKNVTPDRSKIHTHDATELKYWSRALCASEIDILAAVEKVGNSVATVRKELTNAKLLKSNDLPLNAESKELESRTAISSRKLPIRLWRRILWIVSTRMTRSANKTNGRLELVIP